MSIEQNLITDIGLLKKGDVVLASSGADQCIYELTEDPRPSAKRHQYTGTWSAGRTRYIAVKCKRPMKTVTRTNTYNNKPYTYKELEFRMPVASDPVEKIDFNFKNVFRVKQAGVVDNTNVSDSYFNCD